MPTETIQNGQQVAWTMIDGCIMSRTVQCNGVGYGHVMVRRVDGTVCTVRTESLRPATPDDILAACEFFQNIGK